MVSNRKNTRKTAARARRPLTPKHREQVAAVFPGLEALRGQRAPSTLREYFRDAVLYLRYCTWDAGQAQDPAILRAWRQQMVTATTLSPYTINRRVCTIKALLKASAISGEVSSTLVADFALVERVQVGPLRDRMRPHARVRISPEQMRDLCRAPDPTTLMGLRDRALLLTLASSGCRISEMASLRQEQIRATGPHWQLEIWGKNQSAPRLAPLSREAHDWINRWLQARGRFLSSPWIFTAVNWYFNPEDRPLTPNGLWQIVKRAARKAGLDNVKPHDFRRYVATQVAERYGLRAAQRVLGHAVLMTTEKHYILDGELPGGMTEDLF
jgi:site-specific recombinase XerD